MSTKRLFLIVKTSSATNETYSVLETLPCYLHSINITR